MAKKKKQPEEGGNAVIYARYSSNNQKEESIEQQVVIPLDKTGRNVVVMMLDRAIGYFIPYILQEKPELRESFDGFTFPLPLFISAPDAV